MPNKPLVFVLFLALFMTTLLSACGSKGDLYQTPATQTAEKEEATVVKDNEQPVQTPQKKQP
jgi:predicted small lipoprotein YifL